MERHYALRLDLEETMDEVVAVAHLSMWGDDFEVKGHARRIADEPSIPAIGEEVAIARALSELSARVMEAAQSKLESFVHSG